MKLTTTVIDYWWTSLVKTERQVERYRDGVWLTGSPPDAKEMDCMWWLAIICRERGMEKRTMWQKKRQKKCENEMKNEQTLQAKDGQRQGEKRCGETAVQHKRNRAVVCSNSAWFRFIKINTYQQGNYSRPYSGLQSAACWAARTLINLTALMPNTLAYNWRIISEEKKVLWCTSKQARGYLLLPNTPTLHNLLGLRVPHL